jgi:hypothetical protein
LGKKNAPGSEMNIIRLSFDSINQDFSMTNTRSKNQQVMILRNPAKQRDSLFIASIFLFVLILPSVMTSAQGIVGHVMSSVSKQNIAGANVGMYDKDSLLVSAVSDANGIYQIQTPFVGRVSIRINDVEFQDYLEPDIILDGYSTIRIEHLMDKKIYDLPGITIVAGKNRAGEFAHTIEAADMNLVAGNFEDPVRVAHNQPGIVLTNDQANHLSARGQSPVFNNWYLEGLQIVNPNHTSNAGTLSDLPTQYGGGVNMFSEQTLASTDIYTGLAPVFIDHAAGATIDMHLHETVKPEWRAKAGLIGFELGGGSKVGQNGVIDANLRYSFTGLLTDFGADFGGEKIGFYDGVISYVHQVNQHKLKLFAWAGKSKNEFNQVFPIEDREAYKDFFNINYDNGILGAGGRYDLSLGPNTFLRSGLAYSINHSTYTKLDGEPYFANQEDLDDKIEVFSSFIEMTFAHSSSWHSIFGIHFNKRAYEHDINSTLPFPEESAGKFYVESTLDLPQRIELEASGEITHSFQYDEWKPGYRFQLSKALGVRSKIFAGIRQSPGEPLYIVQHPSVNQYFISRNLETGWQYTGDIHALRLNVYWQHAYDLIVFQAEEARYYLPDMPLIPVPVPVTQINQQGEADQYGIEGSWSIVTAKNWRLELNQSVYKSERGISGGKNTGGRYDGRYTTHVSWAKEIIREKNGKNRIWIFALRGLLNGGLWEPAIDPLNSEVLEATIARYPGIYDQQLPAYKRIDASITRTIATSKIRWQYKLDIQNLFSFTNIAYHYYDPYLHEIVVQEQLGFIPVLSVQASW